MRKVLTNNQKPATAQALPRWCAELVREITDGVPEADRPTVRERLEARRPIWTGLDEAGWKRVMVQCLVGVIDEALNNTRPKAKPTAYWVQVENACRGVQDALQGRGDLNAAMREVEASVMTRWAAARAAAWAVWVAAAWAVWSAVWAARPKDRPASWLRIANILFNAMDAEGALVVMKGTDNG